MDGGYNDADAAPIAVAASHGRGSVSVSTEQPGPRCPADSNPGEGPGSGAGQTLNDQIPIAKSARHGRAGPKSQLPKRQTDVGRSPPDVAFRPRWGPGACVSGVDAAPSGAAVLRRATTSAAADAAPALAARCVCCGGATRYDSWGSGGAPRQQVRRRRELRSYGKACTAPEMAMLHLCDGCIVPAHDTPPNELKRNLVLCI